MEIVFVVTHLIMVICLVSIVWVVVSSNNNQKDAFEKSKPIQKPILLQRFQINPDVFYRITMIISLFFNM